MINLKDILDQLNVPRQCNKYGLGLWQCPSFLFLVMGLIIIVTAILAYAIGNRYIADPQIVALIVLVLASILFVISFVIIQGFEKLAEANRMKSEFINVVSHQLRTPLSNLKWAIELLMSGRVNSMTAKQAEYFMILKENSARMEELVSDLLIVARIETAKLPLKKIEFSLEDLIKDLIAEFEPFTKASNVEISLETEKNLPRIANDPSQIKIVIENLIDNAIRYIKDKGKVAIRLLRKDKNIYFEIKDNGVGIPKEDQKYIFQKFFRSENVVKYQTQGSGLGLYISKAIIEGSGGKIGFQSQGGRGSTFWFTLLIR